MRDTAITWRCRPSPLYVLQSVKALSIKRHSGNRVDENRIKSHIESITSLDKK